jgi:uncharacterized protein YjiS (DUF1127 family)
MASSIKVFSTGARAPSRASRLAGALQRGWHAYWARRARSATVFLLRGLDDRTLQDIGVNRSEIESVVCARAQDRIRRYESSWQ